MKTWRVLPVIVNLLGWLFPVLAFALAIYLLAPEQARALIGF